MKTSSICLRVKDAFCHRTHLSHKSVQSGAGVVFDPSESVWLFASFRSRFVTVHVSTTTLFLRAFLSEHHSLVQSMEYCGPLSLSSRYFWIYRSPDVCLRFSLKTLINQQLGHSFFFFRPSYLHHGKKLNWNIMWNWIGRCDTVESSKRFLWSLPTLVAFTWFVLRSVTHTRCGDGNAVPFKVCIHLIICSHLASSSFLQARTSSTRFPAVAFGNHPHLENFLYSHENQTFLKK